MERLLERESELERIARAAAGAAEGEQALVVVEGAVGLGKTVLLSEARRRLRQGQTTVLAARPGEQEAAFPYRVLRQLLGPAAGGAAVRGAGRTVCRPGGQGARSTRRRGGRAAAL